MNNSEQSIEHQFQIDTNNLLTFSFSLDNFINTNTSQEEIDSFINNNIIPTLKKSISHYQKKLEVPTTYNKFSSFPQQYTYESNVQLNTNNHCSGANNSHHIKPQLTDEEVVSSTRLLSLVNILEKMGLCKKSPFIDTYAFGDSRQNYVINNSGWNSPHGKSGNDSYELINELIHTTHINQAVSKEDFLTLIANALRKNYI